MRRFGSAIVLTLATCALTTAASAQAYPHRAIRIVVPFAPGGGVDILARLVSGKLSELVGQPVLVDHRPGAGGNLGADVVAKSPPDGYTVLLTTSGHASSPALYRTLPFDPVKDFVPVTQVIATQFVLIASPKFKAASLQDLIAQAKAAPGTLNYGSSGVGAPLHLAMEMFKHAAGVDIVHVPYRGDAPVLTGLMSGDVQIGFVPQSSAVQHIQGNLVRALAVTGAKRSAALPDVPTVAEAGISGMEGGSWNGLFAPAATPPDVVLALQKGVARTLETPEVRDRIVAVGQEPVGNTPQAFEAQFKADIARFSRIVEQARIPKLD